MRSAAVLIAGTPLALVASCHGTQARNAMAYVETCTPGTSYDACHAALWPHDSHDEAVQAAFPANGLVAIRIGTMPAVFDPAPGQPLHVVVRTSFDYEMQATTDAAYATMVKVLTSELGPPAHGRAPVRGTLQPYAHVDPDELYWVTEEGDWACAPGGTLHWYSLPLEGFAPGNTEDHLDKYVRPAPKSAALWRKVGQALIDH